MNTKVVGPYAVKTERVPNGWRVAIVGVGVRSNGSTFEHTCWVGESSDRDRLTKIARAKVAEIEREQA